MRIRLLVPGCAGDLFKEVNQAYGPVLGLIGQDGCYACWIDIGLRQFRRMWVSGDTGVDNMSVIAVDCTRMVALCKYDDAGTDLYFEQRFTMVVDCETGKLTIAAGKRAPTVWDVD